MTGPVECPMCDQEVPLDGEYGVPVCADCQRWLEGLDGHLGELEVSDPALRAAGDRVRGFTDKWGEL